MMKNEAGVRIEEMLCQLADATRIDGEIWRAAYTLEDKIAKNILREWIEDMGLEYREDAIGNVYGRLPGTEPGTVLTGSHLDTVKNGGKYDGALGVVTGVAALGYLKQSGFVPKHSLEVAGLMEEEGSRFPYFKRENVNLETAEYLYRILAFAQHTENDEKLVIYQALYPPYKTCARPYDMFCSEVDREKYPNAKQKYRFEVVPVDFWPR